MPRSQQNRSLAVSTPLGEDILLLRSMKGKERLSTLFKYQLELVSESSQPIRHQDLLGQPVTVRLDLPQGQTRYFNGIVSRFAHTGCDGDLAYWVRVAQPWVGKGWGAIAIPRIGQEVVVGFLEGDPDRPIITGGVYNDVNKPPYQLPDKATVTGLKSRSTKEGWGFNEIRLEDKKGEEQLFIQAEKDLEIQVKHERRLTVGASQFEAVGKDRTEQIGGNRRIEIQGNREEKVGGIASLQAQDVIIEAARSITLKVGDGHLVVDHTGVTVSNVPYGAPVINRATPPLGWLWNLDGVAQALTQAAQRGIPFIAEQPPGVVRIRTIRQLCEKRPLPDVDVTLMDNKMTLQTDSDGYATFRDLEQRSYRVKIERKDFKTKQLSVVAKPDGDDYEVILEPEWDLTLIPNIMRKNNWSIAARLMEHWFSREEYEYPDPEDLDYAAIPHNDRIVTLQWTLGFERAKKIYDEMWNVKYANDQAKNEIEGMLDKQKKFTDKKEIFGDLSQPVAVINEKYYFQRGEVTIPLFFDDMVAALFRFNFRMAFQVEVIPRTQGVYTIHLQKVGIYIRDSYDFEDDNFLAELLGLGYWDPSDDSVSGIPGTGHRVNNRDFRDWRDETGCGGDFIVFSDVEIRDVNASWEVRR